MSQESTKGTAETRTLAAETDIPIRGIEFVKASGYTTFDCEFSITQGDLVFHFFLSPEMQRWSAASQRAYWGEVVPRVLEEVAKSTFNAEFPRLQAQHVYEPDMGINSWWLRAYGFGHLLDPHALVYRFLDALDAGLDVAIKAM